MIFLGVRNFITAFYGDLRWILVLITHALAVIKLWFRLRSYSSNRIANTVFQLCMIMAESGIRIGTETM